MKRISSRKRMSQNYLVNRAVVRKIVSQSSVNQDDIVYEIGPGKGIITELLSKTAKKVIAIELDPGLYTATKERLSKFQNIEFHNADFLHFPIYAHEYKVFANTPFAIEGEIVRKLIDSNNPPLDAYLVMDRRVAERFAGKPKEGAFSISHKPWFDMEIVHNFNRYDFSPPPTIKVVLFRIQQKQDALLPWIDRKKFERLVISSFGGGRRMRQNLRHLFSKDQVNSLSQSLSFSLDAMPSQMKLSQWIEIYKEYYGKN